MGDLSRNFNRAEFQCTGCRGRRCPYGHNFGRGIATADHMLICILVRVRRHFDAPVKFTSGFRCDQRNDRVGGARQSQHKLGQAADIKVKGVSSRKVYAYLNPRHKGGLGNYPGFTHVDVRNKRVRF